MVRLDRLATYARREVERLGKQKRKAPSQFDGLPIPIEEGDA
jgi:hypothetical protein